MKNIGFKINTLLANNLLININSKIMINYNLVDKRHIVRIYKIRLESYVKDTYLYKQYRKLVNALLIYEGTKIFIVTIEDSNNPIICYINENADKLLFVLGNE